MKGETQNIHSRHDVIVIHETNGRKYFEALAHLRDIGELQSLTFVEASVMWKFAHSLFRERKSLAQALRQSWRNLKFRLRLRSLRGKTVVLALAPWDYRFLIYSQLRYWNQVIYNSSWPFWDGSRIPRTLGPFTNIVKRYWHRVLAEKRIEITTVTSEVANSILTYVKGASPPVVISHVVSDAFFSMRARYALPFRLLFVGELSDNKGVRQLPAILDSLKDQDVELVIVGDGLLRDVAARLAQRANCRWHGQVKERTALANISSNCQLFLSPAVRTERWEELFGMSIVEAMASGLPCIVTDHVGPRSIITSGVDGVIVQENSTDQIVSWIRRFLSDRDIWNTMSSRATERARHFRLSEVAQKWQRLIDASDYQP